MSIESSLSKVARSSSRLITLISQHEHGSGGAPEASDTLILDVSDMHVQCCRRNSERFPRTMRRCTMSRPAGQGPSCLAGSTMQKCRVTEEDSFAAV